MSVSGFAVVFELVPPSPFGVPEEGMIVFKAREGTFYSDTFHASGVRVALGQLSEYRSSSEAIQMEFELAGLPATLNDNFLRVEVRAESHSDALAAARTVVDRFAQHLGVAGSRWSAAVPLLVEGPSHDDHRVGTSLLVSKVATYNLDDLELQIAHAVAAATIENERLETAIRYFQHAMWLFARMADIRDPFDSNSSMLVSSIMLNMWKAASAIVGDPTMDKDYLSRPGIGDCSNP